MGLSASQSRLLSLTSRMSDLELRAQTISNAKIRLSQESSQASKTYSAALDKEVLQLMTGVDNDGNRVYEDATLSSLLNANKTGGKQRKIVDTTGKEIIPSNVMKNFTDTIAGYNSGGSWYFNGVQDASGNWTQGDRTQEEAETIRYNNSRAEFCLRNTTGYSGYADAQAHGYDLNELTTSSDWKYYANLYDEMFKNFTSQSSTYKTDPDKSSSVKLYDRTIDSSKVGSVSSNQENNADWLIAQLKAGNLFIVEYDTDDKDWEKISWSSGDNALITKSDDTDVAKAEADYEATMADIETKDKRYDLELQNIDTEHTAVQTEVDSVNKVINKNIDRSFKMFDA